MATYSKVPLSPNGVTGDGRGIKITNTGSTGSYVHRANSSTDEIWLWATNSGATAATLSVQLGGVTAPDDTFVWTIPVSSGILLVIPGLIVTGTNHVYAYSSITNVIAVFGYVNRIGA